MGDNASDDMAGAFVVLTQDSVSATRGLLAAQWSSAACRKVDSRARHFAVPAQLSAHRAGDRDLRGAQTTCI